MDSNILTRYELFCCGEPTGKGIFNGENDSSLSVLKSLNKISPSIFNVNVSSKEYIASYFTEKGIKKYSREIKKRIDTINKSLCTVGKIETSKDSKSVLYEDEYQVVQISLDLFPISEAIFLNQGEDGIYSIEDNINSSANVLANSIYLKKVSMCKDIKPDIIVRPFFNQGDLIYKIDKNNKLIYISSEVM